MPSRGASTRGSPPPRRLCLIAAPRRSTHSARRDVAVDGWALTLLSPRRAGWAATRAPSASRGATPEPSAVALHARGRVSFAVRRACGWVSPHDGGRGAGLPTGGGGRAVGAAASPRRALRLPAVRRPAVVLHSRARRPSAAWTGRRSSRPSGAACPRGRRGAGAAAPGVRGAAARGRAVDRGRGRCVRLPLGLPAARAQPAHVVVLRCVGRAGVAPRVPRVRCARPAAGGGVHPHVLSMMAFRPGRGPGLGGTT